MIRNKTIKFNMEKQEDRELWEWLQSLPHGYFSEEAKRHFKNKMNHYEDPRVGFSYQNGKMKEEQK